MASYTDNNSKRATLSSTTVDTVTLSNLAGPLLLVTNEAGTTTLTFTIDGVTVATAGGDDMYHVPAGETLTINLGSETNVVVSIIGDGNTYIIQTVN
jgi:hypothetical protein